MCKKQEGKGARRERGKKERRQKGIKARRERGKKGKRQEEKLVCKNEGGKRHVHSAHHKGKLSPSSSPSVGPPVRFFGIELWWGVLQGGHEDLNVGHGMCSKATQHFSLSNAYAVQFVFLEWLQLHFFTTLTADHYQKRLCIMQSHEHCDLKTHMITINTQASCKSAHKNHVQESMQCMKIELTFKGLMRANGAQPRAISMHVMPKLHMSADDP